jgi:hypothetical protein
MAQANNNDTIKQLTEEDLKDLREIILNSKTVTIRRGIELLQKLK